MPSSPWGSGAPHPECPGADPFLSSSVTSAVTQTPALCFPCQNWSSVLSLSQLSWPTHKVQRGSVIHLVLHSSPVWPELELIFSNVYCVLSLPILLLLPSPTPFFFFFLLFFFFFFLLFFSPLPLLHLLCRKAEEIHQRRGTTCTLHLKRESDPHFRRPGVTGILFPLSRVTGYGCKTLMELLGLRCFVCLAIGPPQDEA